MISQISFQSIEQHQSVLNTANGCSQGRKINVAPETCRKTDKMNSWSTRFQVPVRLQAHYSNKTDRTSIKPRMKPSNTYPIYHTISSHDTGAVRNNSELPCRDQHRLMHHTFISTVQEKEKQRARLWPYALRYALGTFLATWDSTV